MPPPPPPPVIMLFEMVMLLQDWIGFCIISFSPFPLFIKALFMTYLSDFPCPFFSFTSSSSLFALFTDVLSRAQSLSQYSPVRSRKMQNHLGLLGYSRTYGVLALKEIGCF